MIERQRQETDKLLKKDDKVKRKIFYTLTYRDKTCVCTMYSLMMIIFTS